MMLLRGQRLSMTVLWDARIKIFWNDFHGMGYICDYLPRQTVAILMETGVPVSVDCGLIYIVMHKTFLVTW